MDCLIRVDSGRDIGLGHVSRCLTLALALRERGMAVAFACRERPGAAFGWIEEKGFEVLRLAVGEGVVEDARATVALLPAGFSAQGWLVVDHYGLGGEWESEVRPAARHLLVIDDLTDRVHACDYLLNQNLLPAGLAARYAPLIQGGSRLLLGPDFALLRAEFGAARASVRTRDGTVARVFVGFGGSDPSNETAKVLHALRELEEYPWHVDVVVGPSCRHRDEIEVLCAGAERFAFHFDPRGLASLIARADMAIGAGGVGALERCALGAPSLIVSVAENQRAVSQELHRRELAHYLGDSAELTVSDVAAGVRRFANDPARLRRMSANGLAAVDGKGAQRVAAMMGGE